MKTKNRIWLIPLIVMGLVIILTNSCKKTADNNNPTSITDKDGNVYTSVNIGTQTWMVENLKTTKLNDGTAIPNVTASTEWSVLTTPGYCWYMNDAATYKATYGALYNWYVVTTGKLCPTGWHVSSDAELTTLQTYLGDQNTAGSKLKETGTTHWTTPNTGATNESGFTALPGGGRMITGSYEQIGVVGYYGSTSEGDLGYCFVYSLYNNDSSFNKLNGEKKGGFSVRCIKD